MSVKRRDLVSYLEQNGYYLIREGGNHSIYCKGKKLYLLNVITNLTGLLQMRFANKPVLRRNSNTG